jgi:hypothetical protein
MTSPQYGYPATAGVAPRPRNGLGVASLVVAIVGLVFCWTVVGGVAAGVVAVILGALGRGRATRGEANNGPVAVAGIALGGLAVVVSLVFAVIWVYAWRDTGGSDYLDCAMRAGNDRQAVDGCMNTWMKGIEDRFHVTLTPPTSTRRLGST